MELQFLFDLLIGQKIRINKLICMISYTECMLSNNMMKKIAKGKRKKMTSVSC